MSESSQPVVDFNKNEIFKNLISGEEWLTTPEAAAYLKVSVGTLRNMTSNGTITYYKLDNRNRYLADDLRKLLIKKGVSNAKAN